MAERERVLEVRCTWDDTLVDAGHFQRSSPVVLTGETGWYWSVLGWGIGFVPRALAPVLAVSPPLMSEVRPRLRGAFLVPEVDHELVAWETEGCVLRVPTAWSPEVRQDDAPIGIDALLRHGRARVRHGVVEIDVDADVTVAFQVGALRFDACMVPPSARVPRVGLDARDQMIRWMMATAAVLWAVGLAWVSGQPRVPVTEDVEIPAALTQVTLAVPPPPPPPAPAPTASAPGGAGGGQTAARREPRPAGGGQGADRARAAGAGVLGLWESLAGALDAPMGGELVASVHGLRPVQRAGLGFGPWGGRGLGGGEAEGLGPGGPGSEGGPGGPGYGGEDRGMSRKAEGAGPSRPGEPILVGALDRSVVDEVVKRQMRAIRYCYQRQLQRQPELAGKVAIKFVIAADGTVSTASVASSDLGNDEVGTCIVGRFLGMRFPAPQGGGIVVVKYPFLFAPV